MGRNSTSRRSGSLLGDVSGAFADLGTFLPLVVALLLTGGFDATGMLIGFGLFAIATGVFYRRPIPVQPMKAVAALAITGELSPAGVAASGLLLGATLTVLSMTGGMNWLARSMPRSVLLGMQLGLGLSLMLLATAHAGADLRLMAACLVGFAVLGLTPLRPLACLLLIAGGCAAAHFAGGIDFTSLKPGLNLPSFIALPSAADWSEAATNGFLPQIALTLTNAVLLTSLLAGDYFRDGPDRYAPGRLALSAGIANIALTPIGAFPMCHGAGGLAAHYAQGARTGLAPIIFGTVCLALGLAFGPDALSVLEVIPAEIVAALLAIAGLQLASPARMRTLSPTCLAIVITTAVTAITLNLVIAIAVGLSAKLARALIRGRNRKADAR